MIPDATGATASELATRRVWTAVLALATNQLVAWGVLYYAYAVLSAPMARELGVPMRVVAGAFSLTLAVSAGLARLVGRWLDRAGARTVLLTGAVLGPLALGAIAGVQGPVTLFLAFAALGVAQATALYEPAFRAVVAWCPREGERAQALVALTSIAGFANTLFVPLTAWLVERVGWRAAVLVLAAIAAAVLIPVSVALRLMPVSPPLRTSRDRRPSASESRHVRAFNVLTAAFALQSFATTGATVSLVWHLVDSGRSMPTAALLAGLVGASQVPGRLLLTPIQRTVRMERRVALLFVMQACALAGIAAGGMPGVLLGVVLFGAASGMATLDRAAVTLEWWGPNHFGVHSGRIASTALLGRAAAPYAVELMHAVTTYGSVLGALALCLVTSAVVFVHGHRMQRRVRPADPSGVFRSASSWAG